MHTPGTGDKNRLGTGFWHPFFVLSASGMKISGAENKHGRKY